MNANEVNAKAEIVVLPTGEATYSGIEVRTIQKTIRNELLLPSKEPYHRVQVAVTSRRRGTPQTLVAFMLREHTYTVDIAKVEIDTEYAAKRITFIDEASVQEAELPAPEVVTKPTRRPVSVDMVFGTPVPEIKTARAAVDYAYKLAVRLGYKTKRLLGSAANLANYKKYLTSELKAFGNVGHGYTGGIVLADGNLTSTWFDGLVNQPLSPAVVYFNSCQTFNPPLQPAIIKAGARSFVGGKVNLLIGPSEEVFKCFWTKVLENKRPMGPSLKACEKANYPVANAHGISGNLGKF